MTATVRTLIVLLLLTACASAPPPGPLPSTVPPAVIDSFCGLLRSQGFTSEIRVVKTTQPIITGSSIQALADRAFTKRAKMPPDAISATPLAVEIPSGSCVKRTAETFNPSGMPDVMLLQLSAPFHNPFAGGQAGVLARLSLADEAATWYWIPLAGNGSQWMAGPPLPLAIR